MLFLIFRLFLWHFSPYSLIENGLFGWVGEMLKEEGNPQGLITHFSSTFSPTFSPEVESSETYTHTN